MTMTYIFPSGNIIDGKCHMKQGILKYLYLIIFFIYLPLFK